MSRRLAMLAPFGLRPKATLSRRMLPLAKALQERGWQCMIVAPAYLNPQDAGRVATVDGIRVEHVDLPRSPGPFGMVETSGRMVAAALRGRPDIVHVFKPKGYSGLAALLLHALRPALPLVQDTDDWEGWGGWNDLLPYSRPMKHVFAWQERALPRLADAVTVASRTLETQVWGFGVDPARVVYLPNGAPEQRRLPSRDAARSALGLPAGPVVLLYTRFWEYPLQTVVELLLVLQARRPDARLLVVGDGEGGEAAALRRLVERAGVAGLADVRGWSDQATIDAAKAAADVAVAPFADTLMNRAKCSVKLLELLAAGLPVVASRVGQAAEYIEHGRSGLLAPSGGAALAREVVHLLDDEPLRRALGRTAARRLAVEWSWARLAGDAEHAYDRARRVS
jgi:glycosyltransferase involved in cell wall biosynthesis